MFSVIIPLYNKELSIRNTLLSVLEQNFEDFEIIVVDDGSTDRSLIEAQSIHDKRINIYSKENGGVSSARNYGIKKAKFEWICFLDGDDLWHTNHLSVVNEMIQIFPSNKLFATSFEYSDGRNRPFNKNRDRFSLIENYFLDSYTEHLIWTSVFIANIECFNEACFPEGISVGEDLLLFSKLVKVYPLVKANDITAVYRLDAENRSVSSNYNMQRSFLSILNFDEMSSKSEKLYFKKFVIQKIKDSIVNKNFKNLFFLLKKYVLVLINVYR